MRLFRRWSPADRFPLVDSKFGRILELCEGKDVLDCGCIGDVADTVDEARLASHEQIAKRAKYCLGIDIWKDEVEKRKAMGYNVVHGNVETMQLGRRFDVIVASDLIEHLANPGMFLERCREHLREDGMLCLVTPNAHSLNTSAKAILGAKVAVNPEHTCWYDPTTLKQLIARYGFRASEEFWQDYRKLPLASLLARIRPNLAAHYVLVAAREGKDAA
jgi:2-polyprenyl-3-methyl-5-hydroxy-6-metoxy-1,4-benzoquinol methylase